MTEIQKIHNHNHVLFFKKMKPTHLHTRVFSRECSSPMVEGSTEGSVGYFSVAALSKLVIVLPNFIIQRNTYQKNLTCNLNKKRKNSKGNLHSSNNLIH